MRKTKAANDKRVNAQVGDEPNTGGESHRLKTVETEKRTMIITAAYANGHSIAPNAITPETVVVYQDRLDSVVKLGNRELHRESGATSTEQELCRDMARFLSSSL